MNVDEAKVQTPIMLSNYCVECDEDAKDPRAAFIYQGNSLCGRHFKEAKQINSEE